MDVTTGVRIGGCDYRSQEKQVPRMGIKDP